MNLFLREIKAHRKSVIVWSLSIALLVMAGMGKYSAAVGVGMQSMNELIEGMPKSVQNLLGVGVFNLSVAIEYYGVLFIFIQLIAAVHAAMLGAGIIAKEERDKTAEFLMTKPISRTQILNAKLLAAAVMLLLVNMVTYASSYVMIVKYSDAPFGVGLFKLMAAMFATQLFFAALGACAAGYFKNHKRSSALATGVMLTMYMLTMLISMSGKINYLKYFSIFNYFDAGPILKGGYMAVLPIVSTAVTALLTFCTYLFYRKRDLKV